MPQFHPDWKIPVNALPWISFAIGCPSKIERKEKLNCKAYSNCTSRPTGYIHAVPLDFLLQPDSGGHTVWKLRNDQELHHYVKSFSPASVRYASLISSSISITMNAAYMILQVRSNTCIRNKEPLCKTADGYRSRSLHQRSIFCLASNGYYIIVFIFSKRNLSGIK